MSWVLFCFLEICREKDGKYMLNLLFKLFFNLIEKVI